MPRQSTRLSTRVKLEVKSEAIEPDVQEVSQPVGQSPEGQAATPAGAPPARTRSRGVGALGGAVIDKRASSRAALAIKLAKLGPKPPATDSSTWPASELGMATVCDYSRINSRSPIRSSSPTCRRYARVILRSFTGYAAGEARRPVD